MSEKILSGIFINCVEAKDSIFESGKMVYECLKDSDKYSLDYTELVPENTTLSTKYDFYFFNYHLITMAWLQTKPIKKLLPGVKITMVLEVSPNNPFVFCSPEDFDVYIVLDPTLNTNQENVFAFPRPLEKNIEISAYKAQEVPVIGSFGFATSGKGFEHIIDAVNREFEKACVRINIPFGDYTDKGGKYAKELAQMCKSRAKVGVEVQITHDFMNKAELIKWCGENTLNCFLYDRNVAGLAATTDQAISSGRPLITSKNNTFRHIQKFIKPFPYTSLQDAIKNNQTKVEEIQREWSAEKFRTKFEEVLENILFKTNLQIDKNVTLPTQKTFKTPSSGLVQKLRDTAAVKTRIKNFIKGNGFSWKTEAQQPISYSEFGEDSIVYELFKKISIKSLSYLEIGTDNTFLFYEHGFQGVLVETNPVIREKLNKLRPRDVVLDCEIKTDERVKMGLEGLAQVQKTPLLNINEIIEKYFTECPDFVSLDVEGWDFKILQTFDFEKYSPAVFCVETLAYNADGSTYRIKEIIDFFESHGYFSFQETYANNIFVNKNLYDFYLYQKAVRGK